MLIKFRLEKFPEWTGVCIGEGNIINKSISQIFFLLRLQRLFSAGKR